MVFCVFLALAMMAGPVGSSPKPKNTIRHVEVEGNLRFPTAGILYVIASAPGKTYDERTAREDLRRLHETGFVRDASVSTELLPDGSVDLRFRITENPYISEFIIAGVGPGLEHAIRENLRSRKLELRPATPYNPAAASKVVSTVRDVLRAQKYAQPDVRIETEPGPQGNVVLVNMRVSPGPRLQVGRIEFAGNVHVAAEQLIAQMQHTRRGRMWEFWSQDGRYVPEALSSDIEKVRQFYQSRGFASAQIGPAEVLAQNSHSHIPLRGDKPELRIRVPVIEGPVFTLASVAVEGDPKLASEEVEALARSIQTPARYDFLALDGVRTKMVEALGGAGYPMADVRLEQKPDESACVVRAIYRIEAGDPALIGRIRFEGTKHIPDKFLRRELRTAEGQIFDMSKLDASIVRLNKSNLIQSLSRTDVAMEMDPERQALDLTFKVKENELRGIYGTGGMANGGYVGLVYSLFNCLGLGEKISLELDGGAAQSNFLLNMVGQHFLGTPFTIGLSAFHRLTNINVANILPDAGDIVHAFRQQGTGVGLTGMYPLTAKVHVGLGYEFQKGEYTAQDGVSTPLNRSDFTPVFVFDSIRGNESVPRGNRVEFARSWSGTGFLNNFDAGRETFRISSFRADPFTNGKNTFAFRLQGGLAHSATTLSPDLRFYPGTELARGFARGGLSAWGLAGNGASQSDLRVVGADTLLGFSTEYRVPISGPLSGAAFFDIAWTRLWPGNAQSGSGVIRLVDSTSGLLRASTGGELRLQLPVIRQPARLVFAWNPLRLNALIRDGGSPFRIADPRGAVRFILGDYP